MNVVSSGEEVADFTASRSNSWLLPVAGAMLYPALLRGFFLIVQMFKGALGNTLKADGLAISAIALMCLAITVPVLALRALFGIRSSFEFDAPLIRRTLHAVVATPPLYILFGELVGFFGVSDFSFYIWLSGWGLVALAAWWRWVPRNTDALRQKYSAALRVTHGVAALLLLTGFLVLHLANHMVALWTIHAHQAVTKSFRLWYRSAWVEPEILILCAVIAVTGILLIGQHTLATNDKWRTLQTAAGGYFVAFIAAHLIAVLGGRSANVETDWIFANAGEPKGLLAGFGTDLIPYYALAVLLVVVHASLGLRTVLLAHGTKEIVANRVIYVVSALGCVSTLVILAALLGLHLGT